MGKKGESRGKADGKGLTHLKDLFILHPDNVRPQAGRFLKNLMMTKVFEGLTP
jgi:hypothetical protein